MVQRLQVSAELASSSPQRGTHCVARGLRSYRGTKLMKHQLMKRQLSVCSLLLVVRQGGWGGRSPREDGLGGPLFLPLKEKYCRGWF